MTKNSDFSEDSLEIPEQIRFGVCLFEMEDGSMTERIIGEPSLGEMLRCLITGITGIFAELVAAKVVYKMQHEAKPHKQSKIITPG